MTVHCGVCGHQWDLKFKLPMEMGRFVKAMKGLTELGCPKCGAHGKEVLCGPLPKADGSRG